MLDNLVHVALRIWLTWDQRNCCLSSTLEVTDWFCLWCLQTGWCLLQTVRAWSLTLRCCLMVILHLHRFVKETLRLVGNLKLVKVREWMQMLVCLTVALWRCWSCPGYNLTFIFTPLGPTSEPPWNMTPWAPDGWNSYPKQPGFLRDLLCGKDNYVMSWCHWQVCLFSHIFILWSYGLQHKDTAQLFYVRRGWTFFFFLFLRQIFQTEASNYCLFIVLLWTCKKTLLLCNFHTRNK